MVQHLAEPINTTIFSKAVIAPGVTSQPACQIPPITNFEVTLSASGTSRHLLSELLSSLGTCKAVEHFK